MEKPSCTTFLPTISATDVCRSRNAHHSKRLIVPFRLMCGKPKLIQYLWRKLQNKFSWPSTSSTTSTSSTSSRGISTSRSRSGAWAGSGSSKLKMDRSRATGHVQKRTLHQSNRLDAVYTNMQEKVRFIAYFSRKKLKTKFEPAGMV